MKGNNICFAKRAAWGAVKCIFYNACNQQAKYWDVLGRQTKYQIPGESLYSVSRPNEMTSLPPYTFALHTLLWLYNRRHSASALP